MPSHRTSAVIAENGSLLIEKLPFSAGEKVDVVVISSEETHSGEVQYPLRGMPVEYHGATTPINEIDWDILS